MARRAAEPDRKDPVSSSGEARIEGARLEPMRKVRRELVSPKGERVVVEVPVYPPFRLKTDEERKAAAS